MDLKKYTSPAKRGHQISEKYMLQRTLAEASLVVKWALLMHISNLQFKYYLSIAHIGNELPYLNVI